MKICFTSSNPRFAFHVYDYTTDTLFSIPTEKHLLIKAYDTTPNYGITWDDTNLYVCCKTKKQIIAYNKEFRFQGSVCEGVEPGTHQILCYDNRLFMVNTNQEYLHIYNLRKDKSSYLDLKKKDITKQCLYRSDMHHFNSVLISNNRLYVAAHNYLKPSFIDVYNYPKLKYLDRIPNLGVKIHGIAVWKDDIYTVDSAGTKNIISAGGDFIGFGAKSKHFAKGFSITDHAIWAAYSPDNQGFGVEALRRMTCDPILVYLGGDGQYKKKKLKAFGQIHEIRCLDSYDYTHGIKPFLTS